MLVGTRLGASTDVNGKYFIINIPPGTYELKASCVGYQGVTVKEVEVRVDLTTPVNVRLAPGTIEMGDVVTVAERMMVRKDVTSTRKVVTKGDVLATPGIDAVTDVFKMRTGVSVDQIPTRLAVGGGQLQV